MNKIKQHLFKNTFYMLKLKTTIILKRLKCLINKTFDVYAYLVGSCQQFNHLITSFWIVFTLWFLMIYLIKLINNNENRNAN
jgi:hypothetical protein